MNINFKRLVLILILVMLVSFTVAGGLFYVEGVKFFGNQGFTGENHKIEINQEEYASLQGIKTIEINTNSQSINIISTSSGEDLKVHFHGVISSSNEISEPELTVVTKGDRATITIRNRMFGFVGYYSSNVKLDIYIPVNFNESLQVETSSGRLTIEDLKLSSFEQNSTSGSVSIKRLQANNASFYSSSGRLEVNELLIEENLTHKSTSASVEVNRLRANNATFDSSSGRLSIGDAEVLQHLKISSTSGSINIGSIEVKKLDISASSGRTEIGQLTSDELKHKSLSGSFSVADGKIHHSIIETSSGRVTVVNVAGDMKVKTNSGSIDVTYTDFDNNLNITSSSGRVNVDLQKDAAFALKARSSSGRISIDFPITSSSLGDNKRVEGIVGNASGNIEISTNSASININSR